MKRMKRVLSAIAVSLFVACMFAASEAAIAQGAKKETFEQTMEIIGGINPFLHAVLVDHMDEARRMFAEFANTGDVNALDKSVTSLDSTYSSPALASASDAYAIDALNKAAELLDVLASRYPEGCKGFAVNTMSTGALAIPEVKKGYWNYLEAKRVAYEDGKLREKIARLPPKTIFQIATEHLGITVDEIRLMVDSSQAPAAQVCSILKRYNTIELVPEAQRGTWARTAISSDG